MIYIVFSSNPDGIMLCILPTNVEEDVTLHIHFKLIEAFCWENDISLMKVSTSRDIFQFECFSSIFTSSA